MSELACTTGECSASFRLQLPASIHSQVALVLLFSLHCMQPSTGSPIPMHRCRSCTPASLLHPPAGSYNATNNKTTAHTVETPKGLKIERAYFTGVAAIPGQSKAFAWGGVYYKAGTGGGLSTKPLIWYWDGTTAWKLTKATSVSQEGSQPACCTWGAVQPEDMGGRDPPSPPCAQWVHVPRTAAMVKLQLSWAWLCATCPGSPLPAATPTYHRCAAAGSRVGPCSPSGPTAPDR